MSGVLALAGGGLSEAGVAVGRAMRGRLGLAAREGGQGAGRAGSLGLRDRRAVPCRRPGAAGLGELNSARQRLGQPSPTDEPGQHSDSFPLALVSVDFLLCRVTL